MKEESRIFRERAVLRSVAEGKEGAGGLRGGWGGKRMKPSF